jgi:tRNA(fMet)-specific endonuclease VapC
VKVLLDTNAYTHLRAGHPGVAERVRAAREVIMSVVVLGEILYGFRHGSRTESNERRLDEFLGMPRITVAPVTQVTADRYSRIFTALRRAGRPIPTNDVWIAAHALEHGAELLSSDGHFGEVPGLALRMLITDAGG